MAILTGCLIILKSYFLSNSNFKINIRNTPNNKGSVGKDKAILLSKSSMLTARGVQKAMKYNTLSSEKKKRSNTIIATGSNKNQ